ncbi:serine/threonine protein kinase [Paenibacillus pinihumi]|uniref:serine/threonine protein kinase n=1 Tax=Paenibacillus pinihumi TaxID=669462 RepID=UPI003CCBAA71
MNTERVTITLGDATFQLQEQHDLNWIHELGHVFCVFDEQDSGNISFGFNINGTRRFLKYAGARPLEYKGMPEDAAKRLSAAVAVYQKLEHPHLIKLVDHFATRDGYAALFEWFDGENLHPHWVFPPPSKYEHPDSPFFKYRQLSVGQRLSSLEVIFGFHVHVESKGMVAVDFYDGSILYDFHNHQTKICDIDFYRQVPAINDIGEQFWGAARSKSPEEYTLGAPIDARTNVFTMGAIAFGLLGGEMDRSYEKWEAGDRLHQVALRAVSHERSKRYNSIAEFKQAWDEASQA